LYDSDPRADGGALEMWPEHLTTPLGHLRRAGRVCEHRLALLPGETLLFHGGVVPHRIAPLGAERERIVSIMCFEMGG